MKGACACSDKMTTIALINSQLLTTIVHRFRQKPRPAENPKQHIKCLGKKYGQPAGNNQKFSLSNKKNKVVKSKKKKHKRKPRKNS